MKPLRIAPLTLLCALLLATAARDAGAAMSGQELLKRCSAAEKSMQGEPLSANETLDSLWCMGYVSGLLDGFSLGDFKVGDARAVCPPEQGLQRGEALLTIVKWLRAHPEDLARNGRRNAVIALSKAYSCNSAQPGPE